MTKPASQYHHDTSYDRHKMAGHQLDWQNRPVVYKEYPGVEPVLMPGDLRPPKETLYNLLRKTEPADGFQDMDIEHLSLILGLTCSLTAKACHAGGDFHFRSVASAGALYPAEIYLAAHGINGLNDGLYYFGIRSHCLYPIRTQALSANKTPTVTLFLTAIFFRSAWKYRERSYRYHLLDTGHLAENLFLALKAQRLPSNFSYDFDDQRVNHLLGLDETKEVSLTVAHVPGGDFISDAIGQEVDLLPDEIRKASLVAGKEIDYPAIREIHLAGSAAVSRTGPGPEMIREIGATPDTWTKNSRPSSWPEVIIYPDSLFSRRSRRNFVKGSIRRDCMMALLDALCVRDTADTAGETIYDRSLCTGFLAGSVEDMAPGFYLLDVERESTGLVSSGFFMKRMAHICLDQTWLTNAAIHFLFLTNLDMLDRTWGARGYRYAMMTAGRMGERLYIAATAMGLGCCGIGAFYDDEAAELIALNKGSRLLYLVGVGPVKSKREN